MCHLRGILMLKTNRSEQAKLCFMEALALDVKCYESFEQLIGGEMLGPDEGPQTTACYAVYSCLIVRYRMVVCPGTCLSGAIS
jgi:hypothetical protein